MALRRLVRPAEDLFLYPVEKVRLAKGEVGYFPLFTEIGAVSAYLSLGDTELCKPGRELL